MLQILAWLQLGYHIFDKFGRASPLLSITYKKIPNSTCISKKTDYRRGDASSPCEGSLVYAKRTPMPRSTERQRRKTIIC